jgi:hypothetical protein
MPVCKDEKVQFNQSYYAFEIKDDDRNRKTEKKRCFQTTSPLHPITPYSIRVICHDTKKRNSANGAGSPTFLVVSAGILR